MSSVSFIGLGVMGTPMARHLAAAGHQVTVYNRTPEKALAWVALYGNRAAPTPREAAEGALLAADRARIFQRRLPASGFEAPLLLLALTRSEGRNLDEPAHRCSQDQCEKTGAGVGDACPVLLGRVARGQRGALTSGAIARAQAA